MKISLYNNCRAAKDPSLALIYNSVSGALAEVDLEHADFLSTPGVFDTADMTPAQRRFVETAAECGFVVPDDVDEFSLLQSRFYESKNNKSQLDLTISPTLDCNFGCFYCYQGRTREKMSVQVQDDIIAFIAKHRSLKRLNVSWFGGEPLMCFDIITSLSARIEVLAKQMGFSYSAQMTTNGYQLDSEKVAILQRYHVDNVQITIDGPPGVHNKRRNLTERTNGTFWPIIENVKMLNAAGITVTLRCNVDKTNIGDVPELIDILAAEKLHGNSFYLGQVKPYSEQVKRVSKVFLDKAEMGSHDAAIQKLLSAKGFRTRSDVHFPEQKSTYCSANRKQAYVVDHDGETYKCWAEIGDKSVSLGQMRDLPVAGEELAAKNACAQRWDEWAPFDERKGCSSCKMLPVCMGGCAFAGMQIHNNVPECIKFKFNLEQTLVKKADEIRARPR